MLELIRINITIPAKLLDEVDEYISSGKHETNRSEAVRAGLRLLLAKGIKGGKK